MTEKIIVNFNGKQIAVEKGTTLLEFGKLHAGQAVHPFLVSKINNELHDLNRKLQFDCSVELLDVTDPNGFRAYQRTASFIMIYAAKCVLGKKTRVVVEHSVNKNFYCEFPDVEDQITDELLSQIEAKMRETVEHNLPIERCNLPVETAVHIAQEMGLEDKVRLLKYRRSSTVNFYKLDWFYDYFYGQMAPFTGCITHFKLTKRSGGFMLQFPTVSQAFEIAVLKPNKKIMEVFDEAGKWARIMKADTVGSLNDKLCQSGSGDLIRVVEALHEKKIAELADRIKNENRTIVLIAGPSSSGKTTFAKRLGLQLRVVGIEPSVISLDNYYLNRDVIPRDEFGNYDFETIDAIDTEQIDKDLQALLKGEIAEVPLFNFLTGKREPHGVPLKLAPGDVLIMEGIHGLNERISKSIEAKDKFKIFISALTQLNIDDHNRIPTTDTRLVRRIVRDFKYRGYSALRTIDLWPSVLRGENKYIFPYQEEADAYFNSALVYEMCILKQYAEPLLFGVPQDHPAYTEAKRLIKFLDCFLGIPSEDVPPNSILREFVGGSVF